MRPTGNIKEPHSREAEQAVIGGVLCDPAAFLKVKAGLDIDDFHITAHQAAFSAMLDVYEAGMAVDLVTVTARLSETGKYEIVKGSYLSELADNTPGAANIDHYIKIIKEKSYLRKLISGANGIAARASERGVKPEDVPIRLPIASYRRTEVNQVSNTIKQLNKNIERGYPGLPPCYDLLARTIRKVAPGHLWVIGGYTSTGKSAWMVDFICRLYAYGLDNPGVALFSTEMSCEQYLVRMISNRTKLPGWAVTEKKLTPDQAGDVAKHQVFLSTRNLYLYDRLYKIEEIEQTARMIKEAGRLDIIAIDYIQNLWGEGSIYERMSRLAPLLQYLAKDLQVTIIVLSQVSNQHVREKGSGVYGYKGAGEIAASADLGIELERDQDNKNQMYFRVEKNRHGKLGEGILEYVNGFTRIHEMPQAGDDNGG